MTRLISIIAIGFLKLLAFLPFPLLYFISDIFYVLVYHVARYRRKVVYENLNNSFPQKTDKEIKLIAQKFYHHFCDTILETIKTHQMSFEEFCKRIDVSEATETFNKEYEKGRHVVFFSTHYANWEWMPSLAATMKHKALAIYHILSNPYFEKYVNGLRTKFGSIPVPMEDTYKTILGYRNRNELALTWFCSDQTPPPNTKFWTMFLNQETGFFQGGEKIARKTNDPVYFLDLQKIKRGYYKAHIIKFSDSPKDLPENELTKMYANHLEEIINKKPEYWLWTHRRWKHKRPDGIELL